MTDHILAHGEFLQSAGETALLRGTAESVLQLLMEADVEGLISAARHERSADRRSWRNGYRHRTLDTQLGSLALRIPKLRRGSYFPPFLEDCRTVERVLLAAIQESWRHGVSTRQVDDLIQAMGLTGISGSKIPKLCKDIDVRVRAFLGRPSDGEQSSADPGPQGRLGRHRH
jgi:putative transposase